MWQIFFSDSVNKHPQVTDRIGSTIIQFQIPRLLNYFYNVCHAYNFAPILSKSE